MADYAVGQTLYVVIQVGPTKTWQVQRRAFVAGDASKVCVAVESSVWSPRCGTVKFHAAGNVKATPGEAETLAQQYQRRDEQ